MVDDPLIGRILGPNITAGQGGRVASYDPADWDRICRHGVLPDGRPAAMPSEDYQLMSDQEQSDIVFFVQSQPAVDNEVAPVALGPLEKLLMATGKECHIVDERLRFVAVTSVISFPVPECSQLVS